MEKHLAENKKSKKLVFILLSIAIIFGGGYFAYAKWLKSDPASAVTYQEANVKQGNLTITVDNSGVIDYGETLTIEAKASGEIAEIYVKEGDTIKAGDPIYRLNDEDLQIQLAQSYSDLKVAEIRLADLLNTTVDKINQVNITEKGTVRAPVNGVVTYSIQTGSTVNISQPVFTITDNKTIPFIAEVYSSAISQVKVGQSATISLNDFTGSVKGTVERINNVPHSNGYTMVYDVTIRVDNPGMLNQGMTGTAEIETASGIVQGEGKFDSNDSINVYPKLNSTVVKLPIPSGTYVSKGTELMVLDTTALINSVEMQKQTITNIELRIKQLQQDLNNLVIKSNYDGTIESLDIAKGEYVNSSTKVGTLVTKGLVAKVEIDEVDIAKLKLGQEVNLYIEAIPNREYKGTVSYISSTGTVKDGVTTYQVYISFTGSEEVKQGMTVDVSIITAKAENVLMVPSTALVDVKDGKAVRVLENGLVKVKNVEVGISNDTMTEIKSGLTAGEKIITAIINPTNTSSTTSTSKTLLPTTSTRIPGISGGSK